LLLTVRSIAGNYWVSSNGSDSNNGTQNSPFKTISHAAEVVNPGDLVYVNAGNYPERVTIKKSGTSSDKKITFMASPRRSATVSGFDLNGNFIRVEGFQITNDLTGTAENGISSSGTHNEIVDNYLYNVKKTAISSSGDGAYIADNKIYKIQMGIITYGKDWIVEKNEIERVFWYGTMGDADYSRFFGENGIIRKNYYHGSTAAETDPAHLDCFQTYDDGGTYFKNITIEDNICMDCDQGIMGEAHFSHVSTNLLVKNNVFAHSLAWGVCLEDIDNAQIINNTFFETGVYGTGISGPYGKNGIIKNNIYMNIKERAYMCGDKSNAADYNLIFNCWKPIPASGPNDIVNSKDPKVINASANDFHLSSDSPCIDAGDPASKVPACGGKRIDIGAFEKCQDK
jgi:hypothetical protein